MQHLKTQGSNHYSQDLINIQKGDFTLSTDKSRLDLPFIHDFLSNQSYWCRGIPFETVQRSVENSLTFGVYHKDVQIGFSRVVSDFATVAYLGDVFIIEAFRGQGLSKWMMEQVMAHPNLQGLRRWTLLTADAHGLYEQFGWQRIKNPERWMDKHDPEVYSGQ